MEDDKIIRDYHREIGVSGGTVDYLEQLRILDRIRMRPASKVENDGVIIVGDFTLSEWVSTDPRTEVKVEDLYDNSYYGCVSFW
ncbi:hypothetical protein CMI45_01420 [Candidatus Pacearchaeota archaeon]|nr:hypothetical protein [Candidatus Pacearchaeota archaeon]|tara:strand:+ start:627 stop:878 length:252 start_codon:yes stop_codon:yes gene_type:complete